MNVKDLVQVLNQIHLEVSVIETLLGQFRVGACEANVKLLAGVLQEFQVNADGDDISECWCLEKLGDLLDNYVLICKDIAKDPKLMLSHPFIYPDVFNVLLRTVYKYLSDQEFEDLMIATTQMIAAADDYLTADEFNEFIYWINTLGTENVWPELAKIPRVQAMALEEEDNVLKKQILSAMMSENIADA